MFILPYQSYTLAPESLISRILSECNVIYIFEGISPGSIDALAPFSLIVSRLPAFILNPAQLASKTFSQSMPILN